MKKQNPKKSRVETFLTLAFFISSVTLIRTGVCAERLNPVGHEDHIRAASDRPFENTQQPQSSRPVLLPLEDSAQTPTQPSPSLSPDTRGGQPERPKTTRPEQARPGFGVRFLGNLGTELGNTGDYVLKGGVVGGIVGFLIGLGGKAFATDAFNTMLGSTLADLATFGGKTSVLGSLGWGISGILAGALILGGLFVGYALLKSLFGAF